MIEIKSLHHIQICIPPGKESEAREFYSKILGLTEIPKPVELIGKGGLWYEAGNIQFHIGVDINTNKSKGHPAFEVLNLDIARQHLLKHKVPVSNEIQIPGQARFSFYDPFNNRIEFLQKI